MSIKVNPVITKIRKVTVKGKSAEKIKRYHIEMAPWYETVENLNQKVHEYIDNLVSITCEKLRGRPIQYPHIEHKKLHLLIYSCLNNPIVLGLPEAF